VTSFSEEICAGALTMQRSIIKLHKQTGYNNSLDNFDFAGRFVFASDRAARLKSTIERLVGSNIVGKRK